MIQRIPSLQTKKWIVNYGNEFLGDIIKAFGLDLFTKKGFAKAAKKIYPYTTETDTGAGANITNPKPPSAFARAVTGKIWAVSEGKKILSAEPGQDFQEDFNIGFAADEDTGDGSDILIIRDETETPIINTPVNIQSGTETVFNITGNGLSTKYAQSLTNISGFLESLTIEVKREPTGGTFPDNLLISIQGDNGNAPDGINLAQKIITPDDVPGSRTTYTTLKIERDDWSADVEFEFDKKYWIVFERTGSANNQLYFTIKALYSTDTDPYKNGELLSLNGSNWERVKFTDTGFKYPQSTSTPSPPFNNPWTNPTNGMADDGQYATATSGSIHYQAYHNFGFSASAGGTVTGIEVIAELSATNLPAGQRDIGMHLTADGDHSKGLTRTTASAGGITSIDTQFTFGGKGDLWGAAAGWTISEIESSGFGITELRNLTAESPGPTYQLDFVQCKVYYVATDTTNEQFNDVKLKLEVSYNEAEERRYVSTTKDIRFQDEEGEPWYSLWRGIGQKSAFNPDFPVVLKNIGAGGTILIGNDNKLHTIIATANTLGEANENKVIFENSHFVAWIGVTNSISFIGLNHKENELAPSFIATYEPNAERVRIFEIVEGATVGWIKDENCHILDKSGQVRVYTGSGFEPYQFFPPYYREEKITTLPHRNGIVVKNGITKILWQGQYPDPAGIWVIEGGNLYHRNSLVFSKTTLNSFGALEVDNLKAMIEDDNIFLGAGVVDGNSTIIEGIYSDKVPSGLSEETRSHLVTPKFPSPGTKNVWQDLLIKYNPPLGSSSKFVIKQRIEPPAINEGKNADSFEGTWTANTTFICSDTTFVTNVDNGNIKVGDEIIIRKGQGAGLLAHITAITGTTTKTITIDEGLSVTSGTFNFSVERWRKIVPNYKSTKFSSKASLKDSHLENQQFKIDMRLYELEELQVTHTLEDTIDKS